MPLKCGYNNIKLPRTTTADGEGSDAQAAREDAEKKAEDMAQENIDKFLKQECPDNCKKGRLQGGEAPFNVRVVKESREGDKYKATAKADFDPWVFCLEKAHLIELIDHLGDFISRGDLLKMRRSLTRGSNVRDKSARV